LPLHKVHYLSAFHQQLSYCMMQYAEKDPRLAEVIVDRLLHIWPCTQTTKEVLFLNEIEEVLEMMQPADFAKVQVPLFQRVALCIRSPHFQVSERALFLWNNDDIVKLINEARQTLFPIVLGALYKNSQHHWNGTVHGLTYNVLKLLMDADPVLFEECTAHHRQVTEQQQDQQKARQEQWDALSKAFADGCPASIKELYDDRPRSWR
jgi:serine/threonine-protein phosphatase 2A regulatory subunit B'